MAKISTKLLSMVLAVVMLVSMVPMVASAEGALPELNELNPADDMYIRSESVEGNTYFYQVGYWNDDFEFSLSVDEGVTVAVKNRLGAEIIANGGVYSVPLRQYSVYTYYIELSDENGTNVYELKLQRLYNDETKIEEVTGTGFTLMRDGNNFLLESQEEGQAVSFGLDLSVGASVIIKNEMGQLIAPKDGVYTVAKNDFLIAKVTAHDGVATEEWFIGVVVSRGNDNCTLSGIDDAEFNAAEDAYIANTAYNTFLVNATVPEGATVTLYTDEECAEEISNHNLKLKEATTVVYLVVTASDGVTESKAHKLIINTTADPADDDAAAPLPMGGTDLLYVRGGAESFLFGGIEVMPPEGTETYNLEVMALGGYSVTVYADLYANVVVKNNTKIKLDSGITVLYAHLMNNRGDELVIPIVIACPIFNEYTDNQVKWAATAIRNLAESGLGLLKGNEKGEFNGKGKFTRYELAALLCRMKFINANLYTKAENPFDEKISGWGARYAKAAWLNGLMEGTKVTNTETNESTTYFFGNKEATRNEVFRALMNSQVGDVDAYYAVFKESIDNTVKEMGFKDLDKVAKWARPGTYTAIYLGYVNGDNGYIKPTATITRNEVAQLVSNILYPDNIL